MAMEKKGFAELKRRVGRGYWRRIENSCNPGMPDAISIVGGRTTWYECKELTYFVRLGVWKIKKVERSQPSEWRRMMEEGAEVWILCRIAKPGGRSDIHIFHPSTWIDLLKGVTPDWIIAEDGASSLVEVLKIA